MGGYSCRLTRHIHWTAGFRRGFISEATCPPPVMCGVMPSLRASRKIWFGSCVAFTVIVALAAFVLVARGREQRRVGCLNNLRQIDSAIINVALERKYHRGQRI